MHAKVLFISSFIGQNHTGASVAGQRNLKLCRQLFPGTVVDAFSFSFREAPLAAGLIYLPSHTSARSTFSNYFFGNAGSLTFSNIKTLVAAFKNNNYAAVFLDGSLLGRLAKKFRQLKPAVVIISFFHNVEKELFKVKLAQNPLWRPLYLSAVYNEKLSCAYADYVLCFNERDAAGIEETYKKKAEAILPVTVEDRFSPAHAGSIADSTAARLLFVGSDFFANTEGLKWFVKNVMPRANATLTVAGKGMEKYSAGLESAKVKIPGTVENLDALYYDAHMVVAPILSGSGMKIKIAEALMMGKTIAGTGEAWQGYMPKKNNAGFVCNTAADFINTINAFDKNQPLYNKNARLLYEEFYSPQSQQPVINMLSEKIKQAIQS